MMTIALTTSDNPYDPFTEWEKWYQYDECHGYHSCSVLARVAKTSPGLSPKENETIKEQAIDLIVSHLPLVSNDEKAFYVKAIKGKTKFPIKDEKN